MASNINEKLLFPLTILQAQEIEIDSDNARQKPANKLCGILQGSIQGLLHLAHNHSLIFIEGPRLVSQCLLYYKENENTKKLFMQGAVKGFKTYF